MIECTRPGPQWWNYGWNPSFTSKDIEKHAFGTELSQSAEAGSHWRKKMCHSKSVNHPLVLLWTIFLDIRSPHCRFFHLMEPVFVAQYKNISESQSAVRFVWLQLLIHQSSHHSVYEHFWKLLRTRRACSPQGSTFGPDYLSNKLAVAEWPLSHLTAGAGGMWQPAHWNVAQQCSTSKADMVNYFRKALNCWGRVKVLGFEE